MLLESLLESMMELDCEALYYSDIGRKIKDFEKWCKKNKNQNEINNLFGYVSNMIHKI